MADKYLFLLRHAMALPQEGGTDIERDLAPKGTEDAISLGKFMHENSYNPDIALCSPAVRTRETLKNLQENLEISNIEFPEILYSGSTGDYLHEIQKISDKYNNILLLAHNPSIYDLVVLLAAQGNDTVMQRLSMGYKPATFSVVKCKCNNWADIQPVENELVKIVDPMDYNSTSRPTRWM